MNIDDIDNIIIDESKFVKLRNNSLLLSDEQINILNKYGFDYNKYSNLKELLFDIELYLNDNPDLVELDEISSKLAEFNYYHETNK